MALRFNPDYILEKLYEFDQDLGGELKEQHMLEEARDPFYTEKDELIKLMKECKQKQDERNDIRRTEGRTQRSLTLNLEIKELLATLESRVEDMGKMMKDSKMDEEESRKKEEALKGCQSMLSNLLDREEKSKKIRAPDEIGQETGIDIQLVDMDRLQKAENRNLTDAEKKFLAEMEKENEAIDDVMGEVDTAMDKLLEGVDEISDNLKQQKKRIKKLNKKMDKFQKNLDNSNKKLKKLVTNFRGATNIAMDIGLILILIILIGVLFSVLKRT